MNSITQAILNKSKLELDLIKITNATKDTFVMSIKGKVTKFGISTAHLSAMTVDMVGPEGTFGRLDIPPVKVGATGGDITIVDQTVKIVDMAAFKAFVKAMLLDENLLLRLDNGQASVKSMGRSSDIVYRKDIHLKGLKGLRTAVTETVPDPAEGDGAGKTFRSTVEMVNPSPFEIDLGTVQYEVRDEDGGVIARQTGKTYVKRGTSSFVVVGEVGGPAQGPKVRFVGAGVDEDTWFRDIVTAVDIWVAVPDGTKPWRAVQ